MRTCGVILAGGKSSRMGTNKSLLPIGNKTSVERVYDELNKVTDEVIIITNETKTYDFLNIRQYCDRYKEKGPLAGLESALYHVDAELYFIAACDMPFINSDIYTHLLAELGHEDDAIVPKYKGQSHPLAAIYRKSVLPEIQQEIAKKNLRVISFFDEINVKYVEKFNSIGDSILEKHFFNMNNPEQYQAAKVF